VRLYCVAQSSPGPGQKRNEDYVCFWDPSGKEEQSEARAIALLADGVSSCGDGARAARLAVESALLAFQKASPGSSLFQIVREIFQAANLALLEGSTGSLAGSKESSLASTLEVAVFRGTKVGLGHIGDSRTYLVRQGKIRRLTHDHSYAGLQVRLRLISEEQARRSQLRAMLTKCLGKELVPRYDYREFTLLPGDRIVMCTDGLYCFLTDAEILEGVERLPLEEVCPYLISLAERRNADDNLTVQVIHVESTSGPTSRKVLSVLGSAQAGKPGSSFADPQPGSVLDGRFKLLDRISIGGMGTVFKAEDQKTGEVVAIKIPFLDLEADPGFFARFEREEAIGKLFKHPNILRYVEVDVPKSRPYIVTEYVEGETLAQVLQKVRPLPISDVISIGLQICDALEEMHKHKVIHRDLKPHNIMVTKEGIVKVMDFGIAKAEQMRRITFTGLSPVVGTPDYMSPEQVKGQRGDERSDIYSLGAILYEMATGRPPFEGDSPFQIMNARLTGDPIAPRRINPEIPAALEEVILHAMARDPRERYQTAAEMKAELGDLSSVRLTDRSARLVQPRFRALRGDQLFTWIAVALPAVLGAIVGAIVVLRMKGH
jgi:serine/threonine protein phosphatase PrpC